MAQAIRADICSIYKLPWTFADYLDVALANFQKMASTVKVDMRSTKDLSVDKVK